MRRRLSLVILPFLTFPCDYVLCAMLEICRSYRIHIDKLPLVRLSPVDVLLGFFAPASVRFTLPTQEFCFLKLPGFFFDFLSDAAPPMGLNFLVRELHLHFRDTLPPFLGASPLEIPVGILGSCTRTIYETPCSNYKIN